MITLLLFTYRSPEHLRRALFFYKTFMPFAKIIVIDSNTPANKVKCREHIQAVSSESYKPVHLEYEHGILISKKIFESLNFIETPYALFVPDDDFFFPSGVLEGVRFLENNNEYIFAYGHQYGFIFNNDEINSYCSGYYENQRSFAQDEPLERLISYLKIYTTAFYSVFRTEVLRASFEQAYLYASSVVFLDNMFSMQALMRGKGYFMNKPFWFKEMSSLSTSDRCGDSWFLGKDFEKNKLLMEKGLEENFKLLSLVPAEKAQEKATEFSDIFIETTFWSMYPTFSPLPFVQSQKVKIKNKLPVFIKDKISYLLNSFRRARADVGQKFLFDKNCSYSNELSEMHSAIKKSGIKCDRTGFKGAMRL